MKTSIPLRDSSRARKASLRRKWWEACSWGRRSCCSQSRSQLLLFRHQSAKILCVRANKAAAKTQVSHLDTVTIGTTTTISPTPMFLMTRLWAKRRKSFSTSWKKESSKIRFKRRAITTSTRPPASAKERSPTATPTRTSLCFRTTLETREIIRITSSSWREMPPRMRGTTRISSTLTLKRERCSNSIRTSTSMAILMIRVTMMSQLLGKTLEVNRAFTTTRIRESLADLQQVWVRARASRGKLITETINLWAKVRREVGSVKALRAHLPPQPTGHLLDKAFKVKFRAIQTSLASHSFSFLKISHLRSARQIEWAPTLSQTLSPIARRDTTTIWTISLKATMTSLVACSNNRSLNQISDPVKERLTKTSSMMTTTISPTSSIPLRACARWCRQPEASRSQKQQVAWRYKTSLNKQIHRSQVT